MSAPILEGLRVVEATTGLAGPVAALLLAESGADVVKVEPPGGDPVRANPAFATWNRSKRSVVLDVDDPADREVLDGLLAGADVFLHELTPARAGALGLDDATLAARHPHLVVAAVTGYPLGSPDAERPADDLLVQARTGIMDEQEGHREGPIALRIPMGSWATAYLAAAGVMARLLCRNATGAGGQAHTTIHQGMLSACMMHWPRAERTNDSFERGLPKKGWPSLYRCADGVWLHVMRAEGSPLVAKTIDELGPERLAEASAAWTGAPSMWGDTGAMMLVYAQHTSEEWLADFRANDIAVLPVQPLGECLRDEEAARNDLVVDVEDPEWGRVRQAGHVFQTDPPPAVRGPAPGLDQHGAEVRAEAARPRRPEPAGPLAVAAGPTTARADARRPLDGVRVLDFGIMLAGPWGPMLLAGLGADVVKIESPDGDVMRFTERTFSAAQRGKRGIVVDLKNPAARDVIETLVRSVDVVHHNLRYPSARRLGIDYETLREVNPRLVYCHVNSYGRRGERADWPGYDQLFQAWCGWEHVGGGRGNPPIWYRMGFTDHLAGKASVVATLLGLYHRDRTGEGQLVWSSLLGVAVMANSETMVLPDGSLAPVAHLDADQTGVGPGYRIYPTTDGWVAVSALRRGHRAALHAALGVTADAGLPAAFAAIPTRAALDALGAAGVPAEEVRTAMGEGPFHDDPDNRRLRLAVTYDHPRYGRLDQVGALWDFGALEPALDRPVPMTAQHTREVLVEAGFSDADVDRLAEAKAVVV